MGLAGERALWWEKGSCFPGKDGIWPNAAGWGLAGVHFPFFVPCSGNVVSEVVSPLVVWLLES